MAVGGRQVNSIECVLSSEINYPPRVRFNVCRKARERVTIDGER